MRRKGPSFYCTKLCKRRGFFHNPKIVKTSRLAKFCFAQAFASCATSCNSPPMATAFCVRCCKPIKSLYMLYDEFFCQAVAMCFALFEAIFSFSADRVFPKFVRELSPSSRFKQRTKTADGFCTFSLRAANRLQPFIRVWQGEWGLYIQSS